MCRFKLLVALSVIAVFKFNASEEVFTGCGQRSELINETPDLIFFGGGSKSKRNQWPWLAALVHYPTHQFFCGGTLISRNHALTAAHCIQNKDGSHTLSSHEVVVHLGRYNLSDSNEPGAHLFYPKEIIIHPQWNASSERFDADLAILYSTVSVEFSISIQPICVSSKSFSEDKSVTGIVVGWGASEHTGYVDHEEVSFYGQVVAVPTIDCFLNDYLFAKVSSNRTFCAGGLITNSGPCRGDSGGGFYIKSNKRWHIFGIVSGSFYNNDQLCDLRRNAIYTKINEFNRWLDRIVANRLEDCKVEQVFYKFSLDQELNQTRL